jgi:transcriptional regulator with XRE-family HTH domain
MSWSFVFLKDEVRDELNRLKPEVRASFERIVQLVQSAGLERVHEPYIRHLQGPLWEMRLRGKDYNCASDLCHRTEQASDRFAGFCKENRKDAAPGNRIVSDANERLEMTRKTISVEESFAAWRRDPEYRKAYAALEEEFALAAALIGARADAGLTQEQLARRMRTTQAVIARLESGRVKPSTRTLERLATATGTRLRISFEPQPRKPVTALKGVLKKASKPISIEGMNRAIRRRAVTADRQM